MVQIIWSNNALLDLEDIKSYISNDSALYAEITVKKLLNATIILKKHPLLGTIVPNTDVR